MILKQTSHLFNHHQFPEEVIFDLVSLSLELSFKIKIIQRTNEISFFLKELQYYKNIWYMNQVQPRPQRKQKNLLLSLLLT